MLKGGTGQCQDYSEQSTPTPVQVSLHPLQHHEPWPAFTPLLPLGFSPLSPTTPPPPQKPRLLAFLFLTLPTCSPPLPLLCSSSGHQDIIPMVPQGTTSSLSLPAPQALNRCYKSPVP